MDLTQLLSESRFQRGTSAPFEEQNVCQPFHQYTGMFKEPRLSIKALGCRSANSYVKDNPKLCTALSVQDVCNQFWFQGLGAH